MVMTSCISHPAKHSTTKSSLIVHEWQMVACKGNFKAAALLSYFEMKYNAKMEVDGLNKDVNDFTSQQGQAKTRDENTLIRVKLSHLRDDMFGIAAEKTLSQVLDLLADELGFITLHNNPDPEEILDRTKYVRFHPDACNVWIREHYRIDGKLIEQTCLDNYKSQRRFGKKSLSIMTNGSADSVKNQNRSGEMSESKNENYPQVYENSQLIDLSDNDKCQSRFGKKSESLYINQYQSINSININQPEDENFHHSELVKSNLASVSSGVSDVKAVVSALVERGLAAEKFNYPDALPVVERLITAGASLEIFLQAYEISSQATKGGGFGVKYLARAVESLLKRANKTSVTSGVKQRNNYMACEQKLRKQKEYAYKHNLKNAESWAGDLI